MAEDQKATEQAEAQAEQSDLEVGEEQADEVEGGAVRYNAPEKEGLRRGNPDPQRGRS